MASGAVGPEGVGIEGVGEGIRTQPISPKIPPSAKIRNPIDRLVTILTSSPFGYEDSSPSLRRAFAYVDVEGASRDGS